MKSARVTLAALVAVYLMSCAPRARGEEIPYADPPVPGEKSGSTAFMLSMFGTAVPIAAGLIGSSSNSRTSDDGPWGLMVVGGYLVGPSLGHMYAGRGGHAAAGIGIRTLALVGVGVAVGTSWDNPNTGSDALAVASLVLGGGAALLDIGGASGSARSYNEKLQKSRLSIAPAAVGRTHAPGLEAHVSF
jgi:hypothetical protein